MRVCINHPDREGRWVCQKFDTAYCDECCRCSHAEGYCKFRLQCGVRNICAEEEGGSTGESPSPSDVAKASNSAEAATSLSRRRMSDERLRSPRSAEEEEV